MRRQADGICGAAARIAAVLRMNDNILVAAHASPDGDAVGATVAMGWLLRGLGKRFALYNASELPACHAWLRLPQAWLTSLKHLPFKPELLVALDCGNAARLGAELASLLPLLPSVNLDHHPDNSCFGSLENWVEQGFAATGQLVAETARAAGLPLSDGLAEAVYLALVSDTGSFAFGNTSARVFRLAAELVDNGLDAARVREQTENQWTLAKSRLWSMLLGRLELHLEGRLAFVVARRRDMAACNAFAEDLEGFAELLRRHKGVHIACLVREDARDRCKLSLRSSGGTDVRALAARFGGGGHTNAAGAVLHKNVKDSCAGLMEAAREALDADVHTANG
jgi:phosphoesterase RecJ-like protein